VTVQVYLERCVNRKNLLRKYSVFVLRFEVMHEVNFERAVERYI